MSEGHPRFPSECVWLMPAPYRKPSPDRSYCCEAMRDAVSAFCDVHADPWTCNAGTLVYNEPLDEYGIVLKDRAPEYVLIRHCPFCGGRLPESRRDEWYDALEALGFEDILGLEAHELPTDFVTDAWRRGR